MSKLRTFVEQVESQEHLSGDTVTVDKEPALLAKKVAKNIIEAGAKGGRNSGPSRIKSNDPKAVRKREYMRKRRAEGKG